MLPPKISPANSPLAKEVLEVRAERLIANVIEDNDFDDAIVVELNALVDEALDGTIQADVSDPWNPAQYAGQRWIDTPFYWYESWLYARIRRIVGEGVDPFVAKKRQEWESAKAFIANTLTDEPLTEASFTKLLHAALWGNRFDLSHSMSQPIHADATGDDLLLIDDTAKVWQHLQVKGSNRIAIIGDNCGADLAADMILIDHLFQHDLAHSAMIWLKSEPFYVSDAMIKDIVTALEIYDAAEDEATRAWAGRIRTYLKQRRLILRSHPFFTSHKCYDELPEQLGKNLVGFDLAIVKGDLHYRRLLRDRTWPTDVSFQDIVADYPSPVVALRTLKSDIVSGISTERAAALTAEDPSWMHNGKRGTIQFKS